MRLYEHNFVGKFAWECECAQTLRVLKYESFPA